jgi:hypothetical protein
MTRDEAIAELTRRLVESYSPVRIYLFGSVARGDDGPDSDLDFLVVIRDDTPEERLRPGAVRKAVRGTGFARDIVPWRKIVVAGHRRHGASSTDSVRPATAGMVRRARTVSGWSASRKLLLQNTA